MALDENILSRPEYELAHAGKRHWRDPSTGDPLQLAASARDDRDS